MADGVGKDVDISHGIFVDVLSWLLIFFLVFFLILFIFGLCKFVIAIASTATVTALDLTRLMVMD